MQQDLSNGDLLGGRYRILSRLATGGFGAVYRAFDLQQNQVIAIKLLRGDLEPSSKGRERFIREVKALKRLRHPHIVPLLEVDLDAEAPFAVMEYISGTSLQEIFRNGTWTREERFSLLQGIADALDYCHGEGILHRDLKPSNILVSQKLSGEPKAWLIDFGILGFLATNDGQELGASETQLTGTLGLVGTPQYMSPEQIIKGVLEPQSDIYSLALLSYETLFNRRPFDRDSIVETLQAHLNDTPVFETLDQWGNRVPAPCREALVQSLSKIPQCRHTTCSELMAATGLTPQIEPKKPSIAPPRVQKTSRKTSFALGWIGVGFILILGFTFLEAPLSTLTEIPRASPSVPALPLRSAPSPRENSPANMRQTLEAWSRIHRIDIQLQPATSKIQLQPSTSKIERETPVPLKTRNQQKKREEMDWLQTERETRKKAVLIPEEPNSRPRKKSQLDLFLD